MREGEGVFETNVLVPTNTSNLILLEEYKCFETINDKKLPENLV
jgi:hypothetical protein